MSRLINLLRWMTPLVLLSFAVLLTAQVDQARAQEDKDKAEEPAEAKTESSREALLVYAEAAGFQNNKQFDLAAVEWAKFLE